MPTAKTDQQTIEDNWKCIATLKDEKQVSSLVGVRAAMHGDRLTWTSPQPNGPPRIQKAIFRLDVQQNPEHYDWYEESKPNDMHKRLPILEDDVLIWSAYWGTTAPRPASSSAGQWQFVRKRVKEYFVRETVSWRENRSNGLLTCATEHENNTACDSVLKHY